MELNKIINADCMDVLRGISDKYFDLAIVDPPYGIGEDGAKNHSRSKLANATKYAPKQWDRETPSTEYFLELMRVSKNQIIFGGNYFLDYLGATSCFIVWDKENGVNDFADAELAWTSFNTAVRVFRFRWQGMLQGNMKEKEKRIHPTQKPVALYRWLLQKYARHGDKILDTHSGSGSLACACAAEGYDFIAIERDEQYWSDSVRRLDEAREQGRLFIT